MNAVIILFSHISYSIFATDFLYYCDPSFNNEKDYSNALAQQGKFELEESKIRLTYTLDSDEASFLIENMGQRLTSIKYNEELNTLILNRAKGTGVGRIGVGFRFISFSGCADNKARFEKYNIGGFAGGTVTEKMNCVCYVD